MKNTLTLLTLLILINSGCKRSTTYVNRTEDKATGLKATEYFYKYLKMKDYDKALSLFDLAANQPDYQEKKRVFLQSLKEISNLYGDVQSIEIISINSTVIEGAKKQGLYKIAFKSHRDKTERDLLERFILKSDSSEIKITGFNVDILKKG